MLFRPSYCANCGEKIERADWGLLTSRRFCPVCEVEFKGHDLLPRVIVGFGIVFGILGVGSYLRSGTTQNSMSRLQTAKLAAARTADLTATPAGRSIPVPEPSSTPISTPLPPSGRLVQAPKVETSETTFVCGAETKKGTPCSRRVKGKTRCFQHAGMPAMAAIEKYSAQ